MNHSRRAEDWAWQDCHRQAGRQRVHMLNRPCYCTDSRCSHQPNTTVVHQMKKNAIGRRRSSARSPKRWRNSIHQRDFELIPRSLHYRTILSRWCSPMRSLWSLRGDLSVGSSRKDVLVPPIPSFAYLTAKLCCYLQKQPHFPAREIVPTVFVSLKIKKRNKYKLNGGTKQLIEIRFKNLEAVSEADDIVGDETC